jgi:hypothetical protein
MAGIFEAGDLEPGEWEIRLVLHHFYGQPPLARVLVEEGKTTEVVLDASAFAPARLEARLLLDGQPCAGAQVALEVRRPEATWLIQWLKTDADGRLRVDRLLAGKYRLSAEAGELGSPSYRWIPWGESFEIGPGETVEKSFPLSAP